MYQATIMARDDQANDSKPDVSLQDHLIKIQKTLYRDFVLMMSLQFNVKACANNEVLHNKIEII